MALPVRAGRLRTAADSAFLALHPMTNSLQERVLFRFDAARDHRDAELLLCLLELLLDRPVSLTT